MKSQCRWRPSGNSCADPGGVPRVRSCATQRGLCSSTAANIALINALKVITSPV
jgi:hypothetical protein